MTQTDSTIPTGYHTVTPYITCHQVNALIEFLQQAFNGKVKESLKDDQNHTIHAEVKVGDSMLMLSQAKPGSPTLPAMLYLYVSDCDAVYQNALAAGAESIMKPEDMFYGDRHGGVKDSQGNTWWIATRKENLTNEEIQRRLNALDTE